jgi:hypothetical protein
MGPAATDQIIHRQKEVTVLVIRQVNPATALPAFWGASPSCGVKPAHWDAFCKHRGYFTFVAERDGDQVGFAVAESHPNVLNVINLEGDARVCRRLLERLVMVAGERNMSGWFPIARKDVRLMLEKLGFTRRDKSKFQGVPSYLYHWDRNEDLEG